MKCYVKPCEGKDTLFVSYCHSDAAQVFPIIERLAIEGYRVWYDNGVHPGEEWPETIARHMIDAKVCVAMVSAKAAESHNCRNEVTFAVANSMPLLSVVLEDFKMPLGMQLQLGNSRYIRKYDETEEAFYAELLSSPVLAPCRSTDAAADEEALKRWREHAEEYRSAAEAEKSGAAASLVQKAAAKLRGNAPAAPAEGGPEKKAPAEKAQSAPAGEKREKESSPPTPEKAAPASAPQAENTLDEDDDEKTVLFAKESDDEEDNDDHTVVGVRYNPAMLLRVRTGELFPVKDERTVLGRSKTKADLAFPDNPEISGKHAEIWKRGNDFVLRNFQPTNVTVVNGQVLQDNASLELMPCSEILLADEQFFLLFGRAYECIFDEQKICLLKSRDTGEAKVLAEDVLPLDRRHKWRSGVLGDQRIHRGGHAEVYRENGRIYVRDLGSRFGTFVNGKRLDEAVGVELHCNDIVAVVDTEFVYYEIKTQA